MKERYMLITQVMIQISSGQNAMVILNEQTNSNDPRTLNADIPGRMRIKTPYDRIHQSEL